MKRFHPLILLLALLPSLGCGDAVTNPAREGFEADPRLIEGDWVTTLRQADGSLDTFLAELLPSGGRFIGSFEFFRFGRHWRLQFNDGEWDGITLSFTAREEVAGAFRDIDWEALFLPPRDGEPAMLLLTSDITGLPIEYVRVGDLEEAP